jgi:hypothetical protein
MPETATPADIFAMSAEEATAMLEKISTDFRGPLAEDPKDQLARRYGDPEWRGKLQAADGATRKEFDELATKAAEADPVEAVMTGALPEVVNSEQRLMAHTASYLREIGLSEAVVREAISDQSTTQEIHDAAKDWKRRNLSDSEFVKAYLNGSIEHVQKVTLCNIILTQPIKGKAA